MQVLKFSAAWCQPCATVSKQIEATRAHYPDVTIVEIDIDEDFDKAKSYLVRNVPTLVMLDDQGTEVKRMSGVKTNQAFIDWMTSK